MSATFRVIFYCLLLPAAVRPGLAQIDGVGFDDTFEVATWNIEWFGETGNGPVDEDLQLANAATVIRDSGIDLWALQEIAEIGHFGDLVEALGENWSSVLAEISSGQRMAYVFNTNTVAIRSSTQILQSFGYEFAGRPPLRVEFGITLPDLGFVMTAINVHMKAFDDLESYNRRVEASSRIKTHIEFTSLDDDPVIFLGDFNDELEGSIVSGRESPYRNFVQDDDDYVPLSLELERNGVYSFVGFSPGSPIDHIITSEEVHALLDLERTDRLDSALNIPAYTSTTSDHLPVFSVFRAAVGTQTNNGDDLPESFRLESAWPNPFRGGLTADLTLRTNQDVTLELVDALGRVVLSEELGRRPGGPHRVSLETADLPAGTYFLRLSTPESSVVRPVVRAGRR